MKRLQAEIEERIEELLVQRALQGLTPDEAAELRALGAEDDDSFDLAAAAVDLATLPAEPMPAALAAELLARAERQLAPAQPTKERRPAPVRRQASRWLAAAMLVIVAGGVWWSTRRPPTPPAPQVVYVPAVVPRPLSLAEERAKFLAEYHDVQTRTWTATKDPAGHGAAGEVVWSQSAQRGYMRFVGIAKNDPRKFQYQLWIFDKDRDARYPVDGGVFDVSTTGELIVPITARLPIGQPTLFAITVEKPGGVVVSDRKRIVVTASTT